MNWPLPSDGGVQVLALTPSGARREPRCCRVSAECCLLPLQSWEPGVGMAVASCWEEAGREKQEEENWQQNSFQIRSVCFSAEVLIKPCSNFWQYLFWSNILFFFSLSSFISFFFFSHQLMSSLDPPCSFWTIALDCIMMVKHRSFKPEPLRAVSKWPFITKSHQF